MHQNRVLDLNSRAADANGEPDVQQLVHAVYLALDLFTSSAADLASWAMDLRPGARLDGALPAWLSLGNQRLLTTALDDAGMLDARGRVSESGLLRFQRVVGLLPYMKAEELARVPAPKSRVFLTVPPEVQLPDGARHLQRSLSVWISEALLSAQDSLLLASPYWSRGGIDFLLRSLSRAVELRLVVTLAGARKEDEASYNCMMSLAGTLKEMGTTVKAFSFSPPRPNCLFHAKIAAGRVGYLGSANLTTSGLGEHVEVGMPLSEADVGQIRWLIGVLVAANLLVSEPV